MDILVAEDVPSPNMERGRPNAKTYYSTVKPFYVSLRIFGLVYTNSDSYFTPSKMYHCFVVVVMWMNFLRSFSMFRLGEKFGIELISKLTIHAIIFLAACSTTTGTFLSRTRPQLCKKWRSYNTRHQERKVHKRQRQRQRRVYAIIVAAWFCVATNVAAYSYGIWNNELRYILKLYVSPLFSQCEDDETNHVLLVAVSLLSEAVVCCICIFQLGHLLLMVEGLTDEFIVFNEDFREALHKDVMSGAMVFSGDLEYWRRRHQELCSMVASLDRCFGPSILFVFVTVIPISSFIIYSMVMTMGLFHDEDSFIEIVGMMLILLIVGLCLLFAIVYVGTRLNIQATVSKSYLYNWDLTGQSWDILKSLQLMTFYNRLREGYIGITGWNLFYVNKFAAKMVVLMIGSYSAILLKFGESSRAVPFQCSTNTTLQS